MEEILNINFSKLFFLKEMSFSIILNKNLCKILKKINQSAKNTFEVDIQIHCLESVTLFHLYILFLTSFFDLYDFKFLLYSCSSFPIKLWVVCIFCLFLMIFRLINKSNVLRILNFYIAKDERSIKIYETIEVIWFRVRVKVILKYSITIISVFAH